MAIHKRQFTVVLIAETIIISVIGIVAYSFWQGLCDETWKSCVLSTNDSGWYNFFILSILRPFLFTPVLFLSIMSGEVFGSHLGAFMSAVGAVLSSIPLYFLGDLIGKRIVRPWLSSNLPSSWKLLKTQDYKLIFILRWIPLIPFDLVSLLCGIMHFRPSRFILFTFLGILPEAYVFSKYATSPDTSVISSTIINLLMFGIVSSLPLIIYEYLFRKQGSSMWTQIKRAYYEIVYEARINNSVHHTQAHQISPEQPPVVLLYGFFSSRRSILIMERLLKQRGFSVIAFNLGGMLGVFFTKGIRETAAYIDKKIREQIREHEFKKVYIVAHSKGGLVGLYWLLKMNGYKYCDKIITMGTPFNGTFLTWFALITPLGFFWRDVWQMRRGSRLLNQLRSSPCPNNLIIYCCYSKKDKVAKGSDGILMLEKGMNHVIPVPMHHIAHFEYLYKRDVGDCIARILKRPNYEILDEKSEDSNLNPDQVLEKEKKPS